MDNSISVLSLCTGGGGLELGLELALGDVRSVAYVEREGFACEVLVSAIDEGLLPAAPIFTDIKRFDGRGFRGKVDFITGGYPCQPFSVAGQRRGEDDPRHLWPDIARIVGEVQPHACFFENVSGHLLLGAERVIGELERMDYEVAVGLFTAAEVGASHKRERLFILGMADSEGGRQGAERPRDRQRQSEMQAGSGGGELADGERTRPQGEPALGCTGQDNGDAGRGDRTDISLFPPGPNDLDAWRRVLEADPSLEPALADSNDVGWRNRRNANHVGCQTESQGGSGNQSPEASRRGGAETDGQEALEPAICGVANGLASRVDRLRMLGNGVVPLQAAYAFCTLWDAIEGGAP